MHRNDLIYSIPGFSYIKASSRSFSLFQNLIFHNRWKFFFCIFILFLTIEKKMNKIKFLILFELIYILISYWGSQTWRATSLSFYFSYFYRKRTRSSKEVDKTGEATKDVNEVDGENKKDEKSRKKSWLWRLFRFALPLQLALVALLCVACLMEPRCCDSLNNLEMSLSPRLRYESGPPPV